MNTELSTSATDPAYVAFELECDRNFNELAMLLFRQQFNSNLAYKSICEARSLTPDVVRHWTQVPFVPTAAFKELELSCIPPEERTVVFHSSGTTNQKPSRHFHSAKSLKAYERSLWEWFRVNVIVHRQDYELVVLTPPPQHAPNSSLVHMFETVRQKLGAPGSVFTGILDPDGAWALSFDKTLAVLRSAQRPKLILGTAFSYVHLLDHLVERRIRLQLPSASRVMETGGYKNRSRAMPKGELHTLIRKFLGIQDRDIFCEYGMSELSSQAYAKNAGGLFEFPPWAMLQIISPETGTKVPCGETGLIRVFDLANEYSVAAIQTEDLGIRRGNGFELVGRATLAEPRGCSLQTV